MKRQATKLGENIYKSCTWKVTHMQNINITLKSQKWANNSIEVSKRFEDFTKEAVQLTTTWKDAQCHWFLEKCKLKPNEMFKPPKDLRFYLTCTQTS